MTPKVGEELFERMGNMAPSKSSLDRLPKALSAKWEDDRLQFEQTLREAEVVPANAVSVALSLDGVLVPMKDGGAAQKREHTAEQGQLTRGPAAYTTGRWVWGRCRSAMLTGRCSRRSA